MAFSFNLAFVGLEIAGGLWTNSVAVLSDALHDLGDCLTLALTWWFARISGRSGDEVYTFGYQRFVLLGTLTMGIVLSVGGAAVLFRSIPRLLAPQPAHAQGMLILAGIGIAVNGFTALRMRGGRSLSDRMVTWHFVEDVLGWVAILVVGLVTLYRPVPILDPILSILLTLYVLWSVGRRLKDTLVILLQGVPADLQVAEVEAAIRAIPGICDVHHTHVWSLDGVQHVLTTHAVTPSADSYDHVAAIRRRVKESVRSFGIHHATIEFESQAGPTCDDVGGECRRPERE